MNRLGTAMVFGICFAKYKSCGWVTRPGGARRLAWRSGAVKETILAEEFQGTVLSFVLFLSGEGPNLARSMAMDSPMRLLVSAMF